MIVATLPRGVSGWLGLPGRLRRLTDLPITRVGVDRPAGAVAAERQLAAALS